MFTIERNPMGKFRCFSATFFMIGALVMTMVSCDTAEGTDDGDEEKSEVYYFKRIR